MFNEPSPNGYNRRNISDTVSTFAYKKPQDHQKANMGISSKRTMFYTAMLHSLDCCSDGVPKHHRIIFKITGQSLGCKNIKKSFYLPVQKKTMPAMLSTSPATNKRAAKV